MRWTELHLARGLHRTGACRGLLARLAVASAILTWAAPLAAQEGPAADVLAPAAAAMAALEYAAAVDILEELDARTDLAARDRLRGLELLGACQVYLGNLEAALAAFAELAQRDSGWTLPDAYPPRVRAVFDEAVLSVTAPVVAIVQAAAAPPGSAPGTVAVRVAPGAAAVESVRAVVVSPDGSMMRQRLEPRDGAFVGTLPLASFPPGSTVPYWVEAVAPSGFVLGRLGAEDAPLSLVVPAPTVPPSPDVRLGDVQPPPPLPVDGDGLAATPWYESWWFWTVVGVVVAGGATTAAVLVVESSGPRDAGGGNWVVW